MADDFPRTTRAGPLSVSVLIATLACVLVVPARGQVSGPAESPVRIPPPREFRLSTANRPGVDDLPPPALPDSPAADRSPAASIRCLRQSSANR